MIKLALYGKGGVGKSTTICNVALAMAEQGLRVMLIGCDPKADSTLSLRRGRPLATVLDLVRERRGDLALRDMVLEGSGGVLCVEAGGPTPGMGCAGRGIITALETLAEKGAFSVYRPDVVLYDVLGDVVCGGFSMPMRTGHADRVYVLTSGENMSIYAAGNIAMAVERFQGRNYATLGGFILNRRGVKNEDEKVEELARSFHSSIVGRLDRSELVQEAEERGMTLLEAFPDEQVTEEYRCLARSMLSGYAEEWSC